MGARKCVHTMHDSAPQTAPVHPAAAPVMVYELCSSIALGIVSYFGCWDRSETLVRLRGILGENEEN
jgi:hypothetical protein